MRGPGIAPWDSKIRSSIISRASTARRPRRRDRLLLIAMKISSKQISMMNFYTSISVTAQNFINTLLG